MEEDAEEGSKLISNARRNPAGAEGTEEAGEGTGTGTGAEDEEEGEGREDEAAAAAIGAVFACAVLLCFSSLHALNASAALYGMPERIFFAELQMAEEAPEVAFLIRLSTASQSSTGTI